MTRKPSRPLGGEATVLRDSNLADRRAYQDRVHRS